MLVVRADRRREFRDYYKVAQRTDLKIAAEGHYSEVVKNHFPLATFVPVANTEEFMKSDIDALPTPIFPA